MWILQSVEPEGDGRVFRIAADSIKTIGRASQADFIVDAPLVSRIHCRLEANAGSLTVIDLSSTNGTFVNDRRVERTTLSAGDRLRVGRVVLTISRVEDRPAR